VNRRSRPQCEQLPLLEFLLETDYQEFYQDPAPSQGVFRTGMLVETKVSKTRSKQMKNLKVFAITNNVDVLTHSLRSRFMEFHLPGYTFDQFCEIARRLLGKRFGHSSQVADEIAAAVWNEMNSKEVRDVLGIAKLVHGVEDVSSIVQTYKKYGRDDSYGDMD
jgi:AAA+ superfamily predicted ATPase